VDSFVDEVLLRQVRDTVFNLSLIYPERRGFTKDAIIKLCQEKFPHSFSVESILRHIRYAVKFGWIERVVAGGRGSLALYNYCWDGQSVYLKTNWDDLKQVMRR